MKAKIYLNNEQSEILWKYTQRQGYLMIAILLFAIFTMGLLGALFVTLVIGGLIGVVIFVATMPTLMLQFDEDKEVEENDNS